MFDSRPVVRPLRPVTFGRGAVTLRARAGEFLTLDQVQAHVPAVFADAAHESRSEKFVAIPTSTVLNSLLKEGFQIVAARQGGSRDDNKRNFTKHQIRLRHPMAAADMRLGGLYPEIALTNGNDGTSAYWLEAALMRLACLNGLMVKDTAIETQRVAHRGRADQVVSDVIEASFRVVDTMPLVIEQAGAMDAIRLSPTQMIGFGAGALNIRWSGEDETPPIQPSDLMRVRREADRNPTLWNALNVAQEGLIRGGQRYRTQPTEANPRGQNRQVSEVKGLDQDRTINRALWAFANAVRDQIA